MKRSERSYALDISYETMSNVIENHLIYSHDSKKGDSVFMGCLALITTTISKHSCILMARLRITIFNESCKFVDSH
jgi:hypothetical protein